MKKASYFLFLLLPFCSFAQQANEIYLFDMVVKKDKITLSNPQNITNHKGYDNQPFFHPTKPIIYYTSEVDSNNTEIKYYNYKTKETRYHTHTPQLREYSPTVTPDGNYISCIIQRPNGQQDLCMYHIQHAGHTAITEIDNLKVGYHCWIDKSNLLLFILGDSSNDLHYYNINTKKDTILAKKIGRALHKIPNKNAMSFVDKSDDSAWWITKLNLEDNSQRRISETLTQNEDLAWLNDGRILAGDGNNIYYWGGAKEDPIREVSIIGDTSMLKKITRIALNNKNNKVAIVVGE